MDAAIQIVTVVVDHFVTNMLPGVMFIATYVAQQRLIKAGFVSNLIPGYVIRDGRYGQRHVWLSIERDGIRRYADIGSHILAVHTNLQYMLVHPPDHILMTDRMTDGERQMLELFEKIISHIKDGQMDIDFDTVMKKYSTLRPDEINLLK